MRTKELQKKKKKAEEARSRPRIREGVRTEYQAPPPRGGRRGVTGQTASSHVGGELELGHTQIILSAVQDDAGLKEACQDVWVCWGGGKFEGHLGN